MRRVTFRLNGVTVRRVDVARDRTRVDAKLRTSGARTQRVTAVVQFRSGRASQTLQVTGFRCLGGTPATPLFAG